MSRKSALPLLFIPLTVLVSMASAQTADSILDDIARTLPETDAGWTYQIGRPTKRPDHAMQASIKWNKGASERWATVIVYPDVKSAHRAFRPTGKEIPQADLRIDGVGDEAFLWPPKTPEGGAYNLRFRKAQVEIWISGATEEDVKAHAIRIASVIATKNH